MRAVLTALLLTVPAAVVQAQPSPEALLDRASQAYAKVRTARGTFEQTLTNPLTKSTATASGEFQQDRAGGRLSLLFTDPKGDRIVADGKSVWVYLPSTNPGQVIKAPVSAAGAGSLDLVDRFVTSPKSKYRIGDGGAARVGEHATRAVTLVPTSPMEFAKATVWIDESDGTVRQFEVTDPSGLVRRVRLTEIRLNVPVDRNAFSFTPPKGVRVFDQSRMGASR
jgi:outer membrane lipoprotein carrier protein